jgi:nicotinamidase-related amidase
VRGQPLAEQLRPEADDYFVLKPKHSGFYATTLELLLRYLHVTTVILTGLTGDICVLFTANDAYMRDLHLVVPADCLYGTRPHRPDAPPGSKEVGRRAARLHRGSPLHHPA